MIVKSYKKGNKEFLITMAANDCYNVIRLVNDNTSCIALKLDYESANDTFEYFLDMEFERDMQ